MPSQEPLRAVIVMFEFGELKGAQGNTSVTLAQGNTSVAEMTYFTFKFIYINYIL